jgi:OOP family OmpA-OmpF porin
MVLGAFVAVGCKASVKVGGADTPPPPPPAPTPVKTAEPAPTPAKRPPMLRNFNVDKEGRLGLPGPVVFETGSDKLKPESDAVLEHVQKYLEQNAPITKMRIEGHTDNVGKAADNQTLSEKRAMSVARWLVGKGIDCKRLVAVGFGQDKPMAPNDTEEGRAQNRRVAFFNAAVNDKPLGGKPVDGGGKPAGDPCAQ